MKISRGLGIDIGMGVGCLFNSFTKLISILILFYSIKSNKNSKSNIQLDPLLYIKCGSCQVSNEKELCEFKTLPERFLVDCYSCIGEDKEYCNNCRAFKNNCYEMDRNEKFSYEHNYVIYEIKVAKLKAIAQNVKNINDVHLDYNNLSRKDRINNSPPIEDQASLVMNNDEFSKSSEKQSRLKRSIRTTPISNLYKAGKKEFDSKEHFANFYNSEMPKENLRLPASEKNKSDLKMEDSQSSVSISPVFTNNSPDERKLIIVILDLSSEDTINYVKNNVEWKEYTKNNFVNNRVEIISKTSDHPKVEIIGNSHGSELNHDKFSLKKDFWLQDCLNYIIISMKNPYEIIIITSGQPMDEYLYLKAMNLKKMKLILTGYSQREYLSNFKIEDFKNS